MDQRAGIEHHTFSGSDVPQAYGPSFALRTAPQRDSPTQKWRSLRDPASRNPALDPGHRDDRLSGAAGRRERGRPTLSHSDSEGNCR
jgi:hypothetical protein